MHKPIQEPHPGIWVSELLYTRSATTQPNNNMTTSTALCTHIHQMSDFVHRAVWALLGT